MIVAQGRYVGIDLGKRTWEMAIITRTGKFKTTASGDREPEEKTTRFKGLTTSEGRLKLYAKLQAGDKVALEAGNLAFIVAKELEKTVGCQVRVLNAYRLPIIYATDKEDALELAQLVADRPDSQLPVVAVPSDEEMARRKLMSRYRREQQNWIRGINRLHGFFVQAGVTTVKKQNLASPEGRKETVKQLSGFERQEAEHLMACLELYEEQLKALDRQTSG